MLQARGHHSAELDPLGINTTAFTDVVPADLELATYGFCLIILNF